MSTRPTLCLLTLLVGLSVCAQQNLGTRVSRVVVYPEWASVTRSADVQVPAGRVTYRLPNLPAWLDQQSLRADAGAAADVTIVAVTAETEKLEDASREELRRVEEAFHQVNDRKLAAEAMLQALDQRDGYLRSLMPWKVAELPREVNTRPVQVDELRQFEQYVANALQQNQQQRLARQRELRELRHDHEERQEALAEFRRRLEREQVTILVTVEAKKPSNATLNVSYLISGASWYPVYSVRSDVERENLALVAEAIVQQNTGESWEGAQFVLSTVKPFVSRMKPELQPWVLGRAEGSQQLAPQVDIAEQGKAQVLVQKRLKMNVGNKSFSEAQERLDLNLRNGLEVVRQAEARGATCEFEIEGTYSVGSDGQPARLPIGETTLRAERRYSAAPAVSRNVYVTGVMRNAASFPLLPGQVRIFLAGSLVGQTDLGFVSEGERFELFLGLEERIQVGRELDSRNSTSSLFRDRRRLKVAYRLPVKNFLKSAVSLELSEQIPVSEDDRIEIELGKTIPRPERVERGILTWNVAVGAGEEKELFYEYEVEYPASQAPAALTLMQQRLEQ